jgi:hypothetical protein
MMAGRPAAIITVPRARRIHHGKAIQTGLAASFVITPRRHTDIHFLIYAPLRIGYGFSKL